MDKSSVLMHTKCSSPCKELHHTSLDTGQIIWHCHRHHPAASVTRDDRATQWYNDRQWHNEWSGSDAILSSHISYHFYALLYSMDVSVPLPKGGIRVAVMSVACFNILEFALLKLHLLYLEHNLVVTHLNKYVHYTTTLFWHELQVDSNWQ